jgi:hypothetical protein
LVDPEEQLLSTVLSHLQAVGCCCCDNYSMVVGRSWFVPSQCSRLVDREERLLSTVV